MKKKVLIKQKIKEALTKSTSHGIPNIAGSESILLKVIWSLFTLAAIGLCAVLITQNVMNYFEYEVTTKIRTKQELNFTFPSITICNTNFFTTEYSWNFLLNISKNFPNENFVNSINLAIKYADNLTELKKYGDSMNKLLTRFDYFDDTTNFFNVDDNFNYFFHPHFGNCYMFNSNKRKNNVTINPLNSLKTGHLSGVDLELNLNVYPKLVEQSTSGAIIFIHEFGSSPFSVNFIAIKPEQKTLISLERARSTQLPKPYSDCEEIDDFDSDLVKDIKKMNFKYSQKMCFDLCLHRFMVKNCSCYSIEFTLFTEGQPCVEMENLACVFIFYFSFLEKNYLAQKCRPLCPLECQTISYIKTLSSYNDGTSTSVKIYFENFSITEIEERAVTTIELLLSNIGGIAGLFLGISVLSFVEVLAVLIEIFLILNQNENKILNENQSTHSIQSEVKSMCETSVN